MHFKNVGAHKRGFTIVELLVVIAVIAILAAISIVSYGAWKKQAATAQVKSDLNAVAAAMESARTFNNAYPTTLPGTVAPSKDVSLSSGVIGDGLIYCVDGTSSQDATILYYVDSTVSDKGAQVGTCASRPGLLQPSIPANLAVVSADGTTVGLSWSAAANAASYTAQCASDPAFIMGMRETTATQPTVVATVAGLTPSSTFYCRVKAVNTVGSSTWSAYVSTTTNNAYGSLAIATSVDGYWTAAPTGFLLEDGSAVSRTTYSALFAVIGTTYGAGDGSTTFNLPDSRGRASVNKSTDTEFDTMGEKSGSKTEALTIAQIPSHTHIQDAHAHGVYDPGHNHSQNPHSHSQNVSNPVAGGQGIRNDYNSDGAGGIYPQGIYTDNAWPTNNAATTGIGIYNTTATNQYTGGGGAHNNIQPSIVKLAAIKYAPIDTASVSLPAATSINGYWSTPPTGFLLEDGSAVSRTTYSALFAVIGTTYGAGDGSTTFNLPDSRGRASVNKSTDTEFDTMGEKSGSKTEALTIAQIPSHTHIQDAHAHGVYDPGHNHSQNPHMHGQVVTANAGPSVRSDWNSDSASGAYAQGINTSDATGTNNPATTGIGIYNATATNQYTGGGAAHNNIQPSIVKLSAIKYTPESTVGTPIAPATSVSGYWSAAPTGYLAEDGSAVSRATYANLFNAIGTTYGVGDGLTTFNLPDSRGRVSVNKSSDVEFNAMGKKYGEKSHVLTIAELASHTHIQDAHAHGVYDPGHNHSQNGHSHPQMVTNPLAGWPGIRNDYDSDAMGNIYSQGITTGVTTATNNPSTTGIGIYNATATNQYTGGGGAHNEIQPSIVKMFAIKY